MTAQATPEVKKTLTVVDRSAKSLTAAADAVQKAIADLGGITTIAVTLAQDIEFKQSELNALTDQYVAKEREQVAELRLRVKENEDKVLGELLNARKVVAVAPAIISNLEAELAQAKSANDVAIDAAVKEAKAGVAASFQSQLTAKESAHQVETATLKANNAAQAERNTFLAAQITQLQAEIQKERDARVKIAEAEANKQGVTVNAGK